MNAHLESVITNIFMDGLIALYCSREHGDDEQKWTSTAQGIIETMKEWTALSAWNFSNKLYLLEAESFARQNDDNMALEKYKASVTAGQKHKFVHEEGLANKLCGDYHLSKGRRHDAQQCFARAKDCYQRWGALSLVGQIDSYVVGID